MDKDIPHYYIALENDHLVGVVELKYRESRLHPQYVQMSALLTENYLEEEAKKGKRMNFERFVQKVPDVEPDAHDRL